MAIKKFMSFSGGVESTTMAILYGADAKAIWCDAGSEHKKMYDRINTVEAEVKKLHPNFEIIRVTPEVNAKGKIVHTVEEYAIEYKYMPSGQQRWCTKYFKIEPIDRFLSLQGDCELMIGLNFDEQGRTGNLGMQANVTYTYPLQDDGHTRADCEEILIAHNLHPKFPVFMSRGGCRMCFFKTEKEYRAMYFLEPGEFFEVMAFEEQIQDRRQKFYSIMGNGKSLRQLAAECEQQRAFLVNADWSDLYKSLQRETSCGYFCHR